jgi:hypothetical protein
LTDINPRDHESHYLFHIMTLAHNLDLMRTVDLDRFEKSIKFTLDLTVTTSPRMMAALMSLYENVTNIIKATGDRLFCQYDSNAGCMVDRMSPRNERVFLLASKDPAKCVDLIRSVCSLAPAHGERVSAIDDSLNQIAAWKDKRVNHESCTRERSFFNPQSMPLLLSSSQGKTIGLGMS